MWYKTYLKEIYPLLFQLCWCLIQVFLLKICTCVRFWIMSMFPRHDPRIHLDLMTEKLEKWRTTRQRHPPINWTKRTQHGKQRKQWRSAFPVANITSCEVFGACKSYPHISGKWKLCCPINGLHWFWPLLFTEPDNCIKRTSTTFDNRNPKKSVPYQTVLLGEN